jgi:hypothetical protein
VAAAPRLPQLPATCVGVNEERQPTIELAARDRPDARMRLLALAPPLL